MTTKWVSSIDEVFEASAPADEFLAALKKAVLSNQGVDLVIGDMAMPLAGDMKILLTEMITSTAIGGRAAVVIDETLLSPEAAASLLGVSRPFVYKLLDRGEIPVAQQNGTHRKVAITDVLAWRDERRSARDRADALAAEVADLDPEAARRAAFEAAKEAARTGDTTALAEASARARVTTGAAAAKAASDASVLRAGNRAETAAIASKPRATKKAAKAAAPAGRRPRPATGVLAVVEVKSTAKAAAKAPAKGRAVKDAPSGRRTVSGGSSRNRTVVKDADSGLMKKFGAGKPDRAPSKSKKTT